MRIHTKNNGFASGSPNKLLFVRIRIRKWNTGRNSSIYLTLSFLSLTASHQGLGWPGIICGFFYLSEVYYDTATTDLFFIRVNTVFTQGQKGLQLNFSIFFESTKVTNYSAALPQKISRGHYLPREWEEGVTTNFATH